MQVRDPCGLDASVKRRVDQSLKIGENYDALEKVDKSINKLKDELPDLKDSRNFYLLSCFGGNISIIGLTTWFLVAITASIFWPVTICMLVVGAAQLGLILGIYHSKINKVNTQLQLASNQAKELNNQAMVCDKDLSEYINSLQQSSPGCDRFVIDSGERNFRLFIY